MNAANLKGPNNVFAKRLKEAMDDKGIKQKELADILEIKRQTVSLYTTGVSLPPLEKLVDIANYFEISTDYLLGLSDLPTTDKDIDFINKYTGLSKKSIDKLCDINKLKNDLPLIKTELDFINSLISSGFFYESTKNLHDYIDSLLFSKMIRLDNPDINTSTHYISLDFENLTIEKDNTKRELLDTLDNENDIQALNIYKLQKQFVKFVEIFAEKKVDNFKNSESITGYLNSNIKTQNDFFQKLNPQQSLKDACDFIEKISKLPGYAEVLKKDSKE